MSGATAELDIIGRDVSMHFDDFRERQVRDHKDE